MKQKTNQKRKFWPSWNISTRLSVLRIENDKNITSVFINSKWTVDKNDNILKPSIKTVNNFLMFFDNDDNVNKITSNDIFNSWNIQLMNIYNNVINMQNYIQFFIRLKDLKDDKELQEFCIDQTGFNDNQIVIEKNNNILHKFKTSKIKDDDKKTVEEFINEIKKKKKELKKKNLIMKFIL